MLHLQMRKKTNQTMNCKHLFLKRFVHAKNCSCAKIGCIILVLYFLFLWSLEAPCLFHLYVFLFIFLFCVHFVCCSFCLVLLSFSQLCVFDIFPLCFWCFSFSTCVFCGSLSLGISLFCLLVVLLFFCCPCPFVCALSFFFAFLSDFCLLRSFTHLYLLFFALCFLFLVFFCFCLPFSFFFCLLLFLFVFCFCLLT